MKKLLLAVFIFSAVSSYSFAQTKKDPKACYKRCMEEIDDKQKCEYICYKKE